MKKGFTLVELLVAIGLFTVIVSIAAGGFTTALRTQRQVAGLISAQSNAGLALEQIAREIRTGYLFCHDLNDAATCTCTQLGPNTRNCINLDFYNAEGQHAIYALTNGSLTKDSGSGPQAVTSDNIVVDNLSFSVFGNTEGDRWNPRITISIGVSPSSSDPAVKDTILNLQTTISARAIDCTQTTPASC